VVLTDATAPELNAVNDAIVKGVSAFVLAEKSCLDVLIMVLNLVALGGRFVPVEFLFGRRVPRMLVAEKPPRKLHTTAKLTPREVEVVSLLKLGKGNELIAQALGISDATAKIHVSNVIRKMGAVNRTQAALNAD
jgi:DNA-binding NarL/FixJ family response regulator